MHIRIFGGRAKEGVEILQSGRVLDIITYANLGDLGVSKGAGSNFTLLL